VSRLRELILVLAVQGKLTRRDALAEPAPALLVRILQQKESLIAAGKVKRDKPLPAIDEADVPFDLPQSWCWTRLGSVTNYGSPTKGDSIGPETWVLDLEDIEKATGRLLHRVRRSERPSLSEKNSFQAGDVLYGKLRPYLNKVIVADEPGVCTTELVPFRCYGDWVPQYFKTALSSPAFLEYVNARSYGMKMPRLGTEDARSALLPLPPLEEQARIVARVDELMRLCDALKAKSRLEAEQHARLLGTLLGTLTDSSTPEELAANWQRVADHFDLLLDRPEAVDALEQTILQLAVRGLLVPQDPSDQPAASLVEPSTRGQTSKIGSQTALGAGLEAMSDATELLPAGWKVVQLRQVAETRLGKMLDKAKNRGLPRPYLRNTNVQWRRFELEDVKVMNLEQSELAEFRLAPGDLLICEGGEPGRCAIWRDCEREMYFQKAIHRVRPRAGVAAEYIAIALELDALSGALSAYFTGATIKHFVGQALQRYEFPLPPSAEQARIVARVTELRRLCANLRQRLTASQTTQSHLAEALVAEVA